MEIGIFFINRSTSICSGLNSKISSRLKEGTPILDGSMLLNITLSAEEYLLLEKFMCSSTKEYLSRTGEKEVPSHLLPTFINKILVDLLVAGMVYFTNDDQSKANGLFIKHVRHVKTTKSSLN